MFVTNHVLSGVMIGQVLSGRPVVAGVAGLASHLVLDAVPHWGCDYRQSGAKEEFLRAARIDGLLGLAVIAVAGVVTEKRTRLATAAAVVGAVVLDLDKPFSHFLGLDPFPDLVNRAHRRVQNESVRGLPLELGYAALFAMVDSAMLTRRRHTS